MAAGLLLISSLQLAVGDLPVVTVLHGDVKAKPGGTRLARQESFVTSSNASQIFRGKIAINLPYPQSGHWALYEYHSCMIQ